MTKNTRTPAPGKSWGEVVQRSAKGYQTEITNCKGEKKRLHRFAMVGKGEKLLCKGGGRLYVKTRKTKSEVLVSPAWKKKWEIKISNRLYQVLVKEIETPDELLGYELLTGCHYRNGAGASRRAPLIAKINSPDLPEVIGFVEISSSFLVNVARKKVLDVAFQDRTRRDIHWKQWDLDTAKNYTNAIARISRCVVFPEIRGIGLAGILAEAAVHFAQKRWHIGGLQPVFMEITAEMLRYWPFVEKSGFVFVGETEGNGARLVKSMDYLLKRMDNNEGLPQGGGGILSMYRSHAESLTAVMKDREISLEEMIERIQKSPEKLTANDWVSLHHIYRHPKPVYMIGLTGSARKHLRTTVPTKLSPGRPRWEAKNLVKFEKIRVCASARPDSSKEARQIQEAFGIVTKKFDNEVIKGLNMEVHCGEVVLVTGASGTGKSLLLQAIVQHARKPKKSLALKKGIKSEGKISSPRVKAVVATPPPKTKSPISLLIERGLSLEKSLNLLASAGLAEAQLFVRQSDTLSTGQRYRLSLALALSKSPELLVVDEFCESLDKFSAAAVCRRLRKEATRNGTAIIVATVDYDKVCTELKPDKILRLLPNARHKWGKK